MRMQQIEELSPYQTLKKELDKTSVISRSFRDWIMGWVSAAISEAYERGRADALGVTAEPVTPEEEWDDLYAKGGKRRGTRCRSYNKQWFAQCMNTEGHENRHRYTSGADGRSVSWTEEEGSDIWEEV